MAVDVSAQTTGHEGHTATEMAVTSATVPAVSDSTAAFKAADAKMHKAMMATKYTGDADVDFLRAMIPHHQGAIDMAKIVLEHGTDADVRMLAGDIMKAQDKEIRFMKEWLAKHGPTVSGSEVAEPEAVPAEAAPSKPLLMTPGAVIPLPDKVRTAVSPTLIPAVPAVTKDIVTPTPVPAVSETLVSPSLPATDVISATNAMNSEAIRAVTSVLPDMPAPDAEIINTAPQMEFLEATPAVQK